MKPVQAARFRFSMRTLLVLFALIAIGAGLLGRTINGYLRERRVEQRLEKSGADVLLAVVPPSETVGKLLYRFGFRDIFHRVVNVELEHGDQWSNELADEISRLPHLKRLKLDGVSVTDQQLKTISASPELRNLEVFLSTKLLALQRDRGAASVIRTLEFEVDDLRMKMEDPATNESDRNAMRERISVCMDSISAEKAKEFSGKKNGELGSGANEALTLSDEGLLALVNHPTLNSLSIRGCKVTDSAMREVLTSIGIPESDIESTLKRRFRDELMLSGASISGINEASGKRDYNITENATLIRIEVRDSATDLARLPYALPKQAKWELSFPRHVPLNGRNEGGFRIADFLQDLEPHAKLVDSIVAEKGSPELWEIASHCPRVRRLTLLGEGTTDFSAAKNMPTLEELYLNKVVVLDADVAELSQLKNLLVLSIQASALTTFGLKQLAKSGMRLEELHLPGGYLTFESSIQDMDVAKRVKCEGPTDWFFSEAAHVIGNYEQTPGQPGKRAWEKQMTSVIESIERAIPQAEFPWPAGSPYRPEDAMLYLQRRALLAWWRVTESEDALRWLEGTLDRTPQANVDVDELMLQAPHLRLKFAQQHTDDPAAHMREWAQLSEIYGVIAGAFEAKELFAKSLEMRVRQTAWAPHAAVPLPSDTELAELCHKASDSPEVNRMKRYFFLLPEGEGGRYEKPVNMAEWKPGKPRGVAVLAPQGKRIAAIVGENGPAKVSVEGQAIQSQGQRVVLPTATQIAYVDSKYFPISIELADDLPDDAN